MYFSIYHLGYIFFFIYTVIYITSRTTLVFRFLENIFFCCRHLSIGYYFIYILYINYYYIYMLLLNTLSLSLLVSLVYTVVYTILLPEYIVGFVVFWKKKIPPVREGWP
jgi:hypothetical protein